jgi:hypothetical protein
VTCRRGWCPGTCRRWALWRTDSRATWCGYLSFNYHTGQRKNICNLQYLFMLAIAPRFL